MSVVRSLVKNTVARSVTELVNRLGAALFWIIVARQLGATALGTLAFGLSLFNFFITISTLGLGAVVVRDVARHKDQAGLYLSHTLYIVTASSILTAACMIGVTLLISPNPDTTFASIVMAAAIIPASAFFVGRSLLFAAEDMAKVTFCRLGENLVKIVGGFLLIKYNAGVRELAILIAFSKALPFFIILPFVYRFARPVWCVRTRLLRYLVSMIPSFSLISIFNSLFWTAPVVILTRISGEYQAGLFTAAYKLIDITVSFAHGYGQALFPIAARTLQQEQTLFKTMFIKSIKYVTILTLALAAGMTVLAGEIMRFFYGSTMVEAQGALQILAWMIVPFAVVPILSSTLVSSDLQRIDLKANVVSAVAVILISLATASAGGADAAAWSLLLGCIVFFAIEWMGVYRHLFTFSIFEHIWKPALGVLLMCLFLLTVKGLYLPLTAFLAATLYGFFLIISKAITTSELKMVKQLKTA